MTRRDFTHRHGAAVPLLLPQAGCLWPPLSDRYRRRDVVNGGGVLNQFGHLLPVKHASPTLTFDNINRVSELTGIPTKGASSDSFPGDHGMILMIFSCFMLRYFNRTAFAITLLITLVFCLLRIMIGAHWFTDIAVGSLSAVMVSTRWWLMTPASDVAELQITRQVSPNAAITLDYDSREACASRLFACRVLFTQQPHR